MPRILGIDSSLTSTGLCRVDAGADIAGVPQWDAQVATIKSKPRKPVSWSSTSDRIGEIVLSIAHAMADGVDLVVLEGRSYASPGHGLELDWLWGRVVDLTRQQCRQLIVVTPSQRSMYATGKGNSPKDVVLAAAINRFPSISISGNDVADATILAAIGCRFLRLPIDEMPKAHYERVMAKLA